MLVGQSVRALQKIILCFLILLLVNACGNGPASTEKGKATIALTMLLTAGSPTNTLALGQTATVEATVRDANNQPLNGIVITFSNDSTVASINPNSGKALSNSSGIATVQLTGSTLSADTLIATANINGEEVTQTLAYSIVEPSNSITLEMILASGQQSNILALGQTATLQATLKDPNNLPINGATVTFTNDAMISALTPASGKAITNSNGVASIQITGSSLSVDTVTASTSVKGVTITQTFSYSVATPSFNLVNLQTEVASLPSGGSTTVKVSVVDPSNNTAYSTPVTVSFTSTCTQTNKASIEPSATSVIANGSNTATVNYTDLGCVGSDRITATLSIGDQTIKSTTTLSIQSPTVGIFMSLPTGETSNLLPLGQTATIEAHVKDANNAPISGAVVTFTNDPTAATFEPASGKVLTNSNGIAKIEMTGSVITADTLVASVEINNTPVNNHFTYGISTPTFNLINLQTGVNSLSPNGSTAVTVEIVDPNHNNDTYVTPAEVQFTSTCANTGKASIVTSGPSVIGNGKNTASATYTDMGCVGTDTLTTTLSIGSRTVKKSISLPIQSASATAIQFISATPNNISLKGIGGAEQSTVMFKVTDSIGNGIPGINVNFLLNTNVGAIGISSTTATSDSNGLVSVVVNAGSVSTVVRVTAQLASNTAIQSQSNQLTISTGLPHQNGFSLSTSCPNPEFYNRDGENITLAVHASDRFGNPVPDNTAVSFYTEKGVGTITPSCSTVNGTCSVTLISSGDRNALTAEASSGQNGRGMILAAAVGEESFDDVNGDGLFSTGDILSTDLPEAYLDANENGIYDAGERYIDFNTNGSYSSNDGKFNGKGCNASNLCSNQSTINVSDREVIIWSGSQLNSNIATIWKNSNGTLASSVSIPNAPGPVTCTAGQTQTIIFAPTDKNGNVLPADTTIVFETTNGTITSGSSWIVPCTLSPVTYAITIESDATLESAVCTNTRITGELKATVTLPKSGIIHTLTIPVTD